MSLTTDEMYMQRCLQLAALASGDVAPNPMVGAVLVHGGRIIGEGYHQVYGQAHAEVRCIASVTEEDRHLIADSILYVSLEPCAHFGKTPPCADLIIQQKIRSVVIGCRDPFLFVNGKGIERLQAAGVHVTVGVLEAECKSLNRRFFLFHTLHRPYIVLKWAQTVDGKIGWGPDPFAQPGSTPARLLVSNPYTQRLVHKWRSEEMAIAVGSKTVLADDPLLSTRHWPGKNPVRVVIDRHLRLPLSQKVFAGDAPTIVFNLQRHTLPTERLTALQVRELGVVYYQVAEDASLVQQVVNGLYQVGIQSVLVEGGTQLLQSFIDENLWDEARVITNERPMAGIGLPAPVLANANLKERQPVFSDTIRFYQNVAQ